MIIFIYYLVVKITRKCIRVCGVCGGGDDDGDSDDGNWRRRWCRMTMFVLINLLFGETANTQIHRLIDFQPFEAFRRLLANLKRLEARPQFRMQFHNRFRAFRNMECHFNSIRIHLNSFWLLPCNFSLSDLSILSVCSRGMNGEQQIIQNWNFFSQNMKIEKKNNEKQWHMAASGPKCTICICHFESIQIQMPPPPPLLLTNSRMNE